MDTVGQDEIKSKWILAATRNIIFIRSTWQMQKYNDKFFTAYRKTELYSEATLKLQTSIVEDSLHMLNQI